jgi:hypothetical protein
VAGGYGALVDFLASECRNHGVAIHLASAVSAIEASNAKGLVRCASGDVHECDAVVLTVPLPLLKEIVLPPAERDKAAAAARIGFGNVIKILLRFETRWWIDKRTDLADLTFMLSDARIPVWWTQHPAEHPVLTGWFGGPKTEGMPRLNEQELIEAGLGSLADIFDLDPKRLMRSLVAVRAINWAHDPLAGGAYSYATLETRAAQAVLSRIDGGAVFFSGEALLPRAGHGHGRGGAGERPGDGADPYRIECSFVGRALWAGIADRAKHVLHCGRGFVRGDAERRVFACKLKGAIAGVRIGTVPHPAMLLAFADGAGLQQNRPCPAFNRPKGGPPFLHH